MKRLLICMAFLLPATMVKAQLGGLFPKSNNQQMIEKAVQKGIVLVKQDYQLEDTVSGNLYNWNNGTEFGSGISFLINLEGGYVTTDKVLSPWNYDSKFKDYSGKQYRPLHLRTSTMTVNDTAWQNQPKVISPMNVNKLSDNLFYAQDTVSMEGGFSRFVKYGKKEAWIVWFQSKDIDSESNPHLSFSVYRKEITIYNLTKAYDIDEPLSAENVIGGVMLEPVYDGFGRITFAVIGIIEKNGDRYRMSLLPPGESVAAGVNPSNALTPAGSHPKSNIKDKINSEKSKK